MTALHRALAALGSLVAAIAATWILGRRAGAAATKSKIQQEDAAHARRIEERADAARAVTDDPVERLRKAGRLRD